MGSEAPLHTPLGPLVLDIDRAQVLRNGRPVALRPKTFALLVHLADRAGTVVRKPELMDAVWPGLFVTDDSLTQAISELRGALDDREQKLIKTIPKRGYLFDESVERVAPAKVTADPVPPMPGPDAISGPAHLREPAVGAPPLSTTGVDMSQPVAGFGGRPAVAVLPFINLSGDPEQEYFADGLAEDILTRLAMWRWLPVIARNSSFAYRGRLGDIREIGRSLGARYVLEGSVRKAGGRVRVTGQLIDTVSGHHLWAQRYERILDDLFVLQDELTDHIVGALEAVVGHAVIERARVAPPGSLDAWDLHARGWWHLHRYTREDFVVAESLLQRALQIDPGLAMAHSGLALVQVWRVFSLWADDPQRSVSQAMDRARAALAADPLDSMAHAIMAMALVYARRHDEAHDASRKAIELNPSNAFAYGVIGWVHLYRGDSGPGIPAIETALRLSPNDWATRKWIATLSACHYVARDYVRAAEVAQVGVQREPNYPVAWRVLAIALGQLGRTSEARAAMSRFLELMPSFTTEQKARTLNPHRDEADTEHWLEGLRKAGWQG